MNKKNFISTLIVCLILFLNVQAQKTNVFGRAENAKAYTISLKKYADFLSMLEQKVDEDVIDEDGNFTMEADLKTTQVFLLNIGFQKALIYLEPGKTYELKINYDPSKEQITFVNKTYLDFEILNAASNELNHQIRVFNHKVDQFLLENFNQIYKYRNKKVITQFSELVKAEFENSLPFLKAYVKYRLASVEQNAGLKSRAEIAQSYFRNPLVFFENDEAMRFFNQLFDRYLMKPNSFFEPPLIMSEMNGKARLQMIYSWLNHDPILQEQPLKELALLKSLKDLYYQPSTNKKNILSLMNKIEQNSMNAEVKIMAENLAFQLSYLRDGVQFPVAYKSEIKNDISENKDLFLHFFSLPCADCVREMDSISVLYKKYSKEVEFVSIALNTEKKELKKLVEAKHYPWKIIASSQTFKLAEIYKIYSVPSYFLISSNNEIIINPALKPWKGFSNSFKFQYKH